LDADDGLHHDYLSVLQSEATQLFLSTSTEQQQQQQWMYWCSKRHLEWYLGDMLQPVEHSKLCISAGITVGYNVNTDMMSIPQYPHDVLYKKIMEKNNHHGCCCTGTDTDTISGTSNKKKVVCIRLLEELSFGAIRSRTPTSAGMMGIVNRGLSSSSQQEQQQQPLVVSLWNLVKDQFHITSTMVVSSYLKDHIVEIAKDNLSGQCTVGHSCKMQAKEDLQRLIETRGLVGLVDPS
jgi:hypothetical protein